MGMWCIIVFLIIFIIASTVYEYKQDKKWEMLAKFEGGTFIHIPYGKRHII
jgi:hypothetical protein